ncbi:MAG: ABC transporter substrate-binding protein [Acutalibacteraceae bacterium]
MKKRILAVLAAAAMGVMLFAGCASAPSGTTGESNSTTAAGSEAGGTFVIGGIGPLTGGTAQYGTAVKNGAEIAIKEINEAGGVNGMKLELNFQDDENNAQKAINAYNLIKDSGAKVLLGTVTSTPCVAVAELTKEDNMFQLTPSGSSADCAKNDNVFRVCFNDPNQGAASAAYISDNKLATKVAVIYDSSDVYSAGIYQTFKDKAAEKNLEIVTEQAFTSSNNTDFSVALQKVKESGAELVFLPIYYQQAALILQQADKAALDVKFFGCDGLDGVIPQLGDDAALAEGVMLLTPFVADAQDDMTKKFTSTYKETYGETPNQFAADAYDGVYAIKAALEKANVTDASVDPSALCEQLKTAMTQITVEGLTGTITWTADGEPNKDAKGMVIQNGTYVGM